MVSWIQRYARWLHTHWPAGVVEKLPAVNEDGSTSVPGLYITGDLTGVPLLKFSSDSGARAVRTILADSRFRARANAAGAPGGSPLDLVIIGAGVSGMAAALEARKAGLSLELLEAAEPFATIVNFPKAKPIYTYPTDMTPAGELQFSPKSDIKEGLLEELRALMREHSIEVRIARAERVVRRGGLLEVVLEGGRTLATHRVIVAIGRSGNHRKLGVPGEEMDKVYNRLHDPKDFCDRKVLVVGGGDSALETAIAIAQCGGDVTLSYRKTEFSRPKPDNIARLEALVADPSSDVAVTQPVSERVTTAAGGFLDAHRKPGRIRLALGTRVKEIRQTEVVLSHADGREEIIPNDVVFTMIGREAPLDFFRRSGVLIRGEWRASTWAGFIGFLLFCAFLYNWKEGASLTELFRQHGWFPFNVPSLLGRLGPRVAAMLADPSTLLGTMKVNLAEPGFYYSTVYTLLIVIFGLRRIRRRKTPYVKLQTTTLALIQIVPLFLLPYIILPLLGNNGWFDHGFTKTIADALFPAVNYGHGREYWRSFGFILAWPLFVWNAFTEQPMWTWLAISMVQTFVAIPLIIYFWGKGAYCGWICSCGAMAETLGDTHRNKMPHGAVWNRVNMTGQVILAVAFLLMGARIASWAAPDSSAGRLLAGLYTGLFDGWTLAGVQLNYKWVVDVTLAGIIGYGAYFWFSGRVWCRFACPLAALMHIYARFSRFRILSEKKKCISCNVCTSVCHQGIDVMNFANKGIPMEDPECVRCSACVQSCPTGTLSFGQVDPSSGRIIRKDTLAASPVLVAEGSAAPPRARASA